MNKRLSAVFMILLAVAWGIQGTAYAAEFKIIVSPAVALVGEPFSWKITGLQPGEKVTLKAVSRDSKTVPWVSAAVFSADSAGTVDVASQAPVSGSYSGADIFGLLWSMQPEKADPKKPVSFRNSGVAGWTVDLQAENSSGASASARFRCVYQKPNQGLVRVPLDQDDLAGFLYYPAQGGPFPGVIILGGSEGGMVETLARAFAANGFAALTLAYFNYPNLPNELVEIPLEYFDRAIRWLQAQPQVNAGGLGLVGGSKGGELALLVAARNSGVRAIVAWTPAAHAWEGHSKKFFSPDYQPRSSWSLGGKPLAYIRFKASAADREKEMKGELASFVQYFRDGLAQADPMTAEQALIPVEKIRGPLLLISGTDDRIWPADENCAAITARLKKMGFPYEVKHLSIENGGHTSFLPNLVTANHGLLTDGNPVGGSPRADAGGGYRAWATTLEFLHRHLDR